ncbi:hypothetical protein [[Phormidium] sp. ETS-05]|uniref:hypothetical protein n=1 Tax=[Phormidium] sp. ETS-05 TaxID=222819 RepID=UPI0018EEDB6B|nr:hypothetical protein [[Phormidium] sp. ETS-05]
MTFFLLLLTLWITLLTPQHPQTAATQLDPPASARSSNARSPHPPNGEWEAGVYRKRCP